MIRFGRRDLLPAVFALSFSPIAHAQDASQHITPLTAAEVQAVRPLADRGAAALVFFPDGGREARVSIVMPVHAPIATVHSVVTDAASWPSFIPAFTAVDTLSRAGRRAAYRFTATGPMMNVAALCTIADLSEHRVDLAVSDSAVGPAGARWDLVAESPDTTLVTLTTWSDPSQGHWLMRRAAASNPSATAGMNLAVDLALAVAVGRRAVSLSGTPIPARPPLPAAPTTLTPPATGPWIALNPRYYVVVFTLTAEGAVDQITMTGQTWAPPERVLARVRDIEHYADHIPGVRDTHTSTAPNHFALTLDSSWDRGDGEVVRTTGPDTTVMLSGVSGAIADGRWRWDVTHDPQHGTLLWLTGGVERGVDSLMTGVAAAREPLLIPGLSALRKLVWLRYMLNGV